MPLTYQFNLEKAVQAAAFIVDRIGEVEKIKLIKLIYLADREHFIRTGAPITGDRQVAMPFGPVPSSTLDVINGQVSGADELVFRFLNVRNNKIRLHKSPGKAAISADEIETLTRVLKTHGKKAPWALANETHRLPEYIACYVEGTSTTIPYETIAQVSGDNRRFRHDRVVLPFEALASMKQTIGSGSDL
jgi:uncharacterized phage-associated protein